MSSACDARDACERSMRAARRRTDRGAATSLTMVALTPVLVLVALAAFQAAMWSHARTEARVVARDAAALVARSGVAPHEAAASARSVLHEGSTLRQVEVTIEVTNAGTSDVLNDVTNAVSSSIVHVTVSGDAPGIVRGTWSRISVSVAMPVEGWVA